VGVAVAAMARLASGAPCRAAGHGAQLASSRFSPVLDVEEPTSHRPPVGAARAPRVDSRDVDRKPTLGRTEDHGELMKLGISVSQSTVAKYLPRQRRPPSQTWRTFLKNHASQITAADLFVVPTITFRLLFVLVILAHGRRRIVHVAVTEHPTAAWTAQQLRNAFPENDAPRYLLHDRDSVFADVATTVAAMNTQTVSVRTAPRSPWQNAYVERVIGSIRRECLDHVIVMNAAGLHRLLTDYVAYYMRSRTHLALGKDTPNPRPVTPPSRGRIVAIPEVGGLHHRYDRIAA
jgi:putative transposase